MSKDQSCNQKVVKLGLYDDKFVIWTHNLSIYVRHKLKLNTYVKQQINFKLDHFYKPLLKHLNKTVHYLFSLGGVVHTRYSPHVAFTSK